ncbi:MAG TPA: cyclase family protein [Actinomycetota bacterium]|nr:cyclase family protein [Actinomycetota bacterium]
MAARWVDLSFAIEDGMPVFPGVLPEPRIGAYLDHDASRPRYEGKAEFHLTKVEMSGNTGTYVDSPFHRHRDREDLAGLALERIAGVPGLVLDAPYGGPVTVDVPPDRLRGRAVLFRSGWDRRWGTEGYWEPDPYLAAETLDALVGAPAAVVGVDWTNVDDTTDPSRPAHTRLLAAGIPIVEHLRGLDALPDEGFRFFAVPPPIRGGASFSVRAFAELGG